MRFSVAFVIILLALTACVQARNVQPFKWQLWKQCDSRWGSHALGTSSQTICEAGCAMSSVSMALNSYNEKISGQVSDPGTFNEWLTKSGGYVSGDLLVWNACAKLGELHVLKYVSSLSAADLKSYVDSGHPVVVNVRGGTHWVLVIGYETNDADAPSQFLVNDPGFEQTAYAYSGMLKFVVYTPGRKALVQESAASLSKAKAYVD